MCDYSGKLIAWLDDELPEAEAINVEWHVGKCAECLAAVESYREISGAFLSCYAGARHTHRKRNALVWAAAAGAVAAAGLLAAFLMRPVPKLPAPTRALPAPAMAFDKIPVRVAAHRSVVHNRHVPVRVPVPTEWVAEQPTVEVALPADAFFPPGAVPAGFSFIADFRPQP